MNVNNNEPDDGTQERDSGSAARDRSDQDLSSVNLTGVDLSGCNFSNCNLRDTRLWNADLKDSDLSGALNLTPEQLSGADLTRARLPEEISEFKILDSADALSETSSSVFLTTIVAVIYTLLTLATTTDVQLITDANTSQLPIVSVQMPIVGFYAVTPFILLALFVYFHIYLQRLWETMSKLPAYFPDGRRLDERTYPWLLNDLVRGHMPRLRNRAVALSTLQTVLSILLGYCLVPIGIFAIFLRFLCVQNWLMTGVHVILTGVAVGIAVSFFLLARATMRAREEQTYRSTFRPYVIGWSMGACAIAIMACFCWFNLYSALIVTRATIKAEEEQVYNTTSRNAGRVGGIDSTAQALPRLLATASVQGAAVSTKPSTWSGLSANRGVELGQVKPALFEGRSLKGIRASAAFFARASVANSNLYLGDFRNCDFRASSLSYVKAKLTLFGGAMFADPIWESEIALERYADAFDQGHAALHSSTFRNVRFNGSDFHNTNFAFLDALGCSFDGVNFSQATAFGLVANRCTIRKAVFADTNLSHCHFNDCNLRNSSFVRANLEYATFTRTDVSGVDFSEADLRFADLTGAIGLNADQLIAAKALRGARLTSIIFKSLKDRGRVVETE